MSDCLDGQVNRRQFLTFGLAVAGGVVSLGPGASEAPGNPDVRRQGKGDLTRWAFLSDTHVAADPDNRFRGFYPYRNLRTIAAGIASDLPDGVVITGDLARSKGSRDAYENVKSLLTPIAEKRPIYLGVGNHDHRGDFLKAFENSGNGGEVVEDKHIITAMAGPLRMIILDTLLYVNMFPGMLGRQQRTWLETYLRVCDDTPTVIFIHHTPRADLLDNRRLFDIIGPVKKVKAVVYGHSHKYEFCEFEGIQLINLPAAGYNFTSAQPVGWVEARMTGAGGEFVLHAVGGNSKKDGRTTMVRWRA